MINAQSQLLQAGGSVLALVGAAGKVASDIKEAKAEKTSGVDAKMALKARKTAQQKINAIYANKELSQKARTRRMGQVMDEYNKILGGNK